MSYGAERQSSSLSIIEVCIGWMSAAEQERWPSYYPGKGEKIPKYRPPITRRKSTTIPQIPSRETNLSLQEEGGPGGPNWGFLLHITNIKPTNNADSIKPGKIPAINSLPMDCSVKNP